MDARAAGRVLAIASRPRFESERHIRVAGGTVRVAGRDLVAGDPVTDQCYRTLRRLAASDLPVLIYGETGSGKEVAAQALHAWSRRCQQPLVALNCAAVPDSLVESELFGFERGAFSGATGAKPGLLESASGGTILLDEIADLPLPAQAKLLRVLEGQAVTRLGSVQERTLDVRFAAASNRDLAPEVAAGRFRTDLFYRLAAALVRVPPLRSRPADLPALAQLFLAEACRSLGRQPLALDDVALAKLLAHPWPGNLRELRNLMSCLASTVEGPVIAEHEVDFHPVPPSEAAVPAVPPRLPAPAAARLRPLAAALLDCERRCIEEALAATGGHRMRAAKLLGVPLRTFMTKLRRHRATRSSP